MLSGKWLGWGVGCARKSDLDEVFDPPRPINRAGGPSSAVSGVYRLEPDSEVSVRLGKPSRRAKGRLKVAHSELLIRPDDLAATRAQLTFDLSTMRIEEEAPARAPGALTLTEQSLQWLRVTPESKALAALRFARFRVTAVGELSASAVVDGRAIRRREPGTVLRRVELRATGDLELHRYRVPYTAALTATFHLPEPARAGELPKRVDLSTREPLRIDLVEHEIVPRDAHGNQMASEVDRLRAGQGRIARVSARWTAVPTPI